MNENLKILLQVGSVVLSCSALIISLIVFRSNKRYTEITIRQVLRNSYMSTLFDLDKQLINFPQLWAIYDNHPTGIPKSDTPVEKGRRLAFIYFQLNLFENLFNAYNVGLELNKQDYDFWESWKIYIIEFFTESSEARKIFSQKRCQDIYSSDFVVFINDIITEIKGQKPK